MTLDAPTPQQNKFGPGQCPLPGSPRLQPDPRRQPGPDGFPLAKFEPGAVAGPGYSPFIQIQGSPTGLQRAHRRHR